MLAATGYREIFAVAEVKILASCKPILVGQIAHQDNDSACAVPTPLFEAKGVILQDAKLSPQVLELLAVQLYSRCCDKLCFFLCYGQVALRCLYSHSILVARSLVFVVRGVPLPLEECARHNKGLRVCLGQRDVPDVTPLGQQLHCTSAPHIVQAVARG